MKKLIPTNKGLESLKKKRAEVNQTPKKEEPKKKGGRSNNTLPPDEYKPEFEPKRILVREFHNTKGVPTKQYLEFKVMRLNDDEGLPFVWGTMYQESDFYTGYLKGTQIRFPLEMLYDVVDTLNDISDICDEKKIM